MRLNDTQKWIVRSLVFDCFDTKSVFEVSPEDFEDEDYEVAREAVYHYVQEMYNCVFEKEK